MNELAYALALGLALVFAWAGVAKLRAPTRTERAFRALGVDPRFARVLPAIELLLAAAIVVQPIACLFAALLLGAFTVVIARANPGVGCACFGSASTAPLSWVQVLRNGMLIAVAIMASGATPVVPGAAAILGAAGLAAVGAIVLALAELKRVTGTVFVMELPTS
jgi:hypothetical protein